MQLLLFQTRTSLHCVYYGVLLLFAGFIILKYLCDKIELVLRVAANLPLIILQNEILRGVLMPFNCNSFLASAHILITTDSLLHS